MATRSAQIQPPASEYPPLATGVAALLFLYVGTFFLQAGSRVDILGAIRFEFLVAASLLALAMLQMTRHKYPPSGLSGYLFFYIFVVVIQVPFSVDFDRSYEIFVNRFLKFAAMALIIATFCVSPRAIKIFIAAFLLSCFKMGQEGLLGNLTGSMVWESQGIMRLHGSTGMYRHPNSYAGMAIGTLPFIYYLFPLVNKYIKVFLIVLLVFSINIILFSGSRTAYVGVFGLLLFMFWGNRYRMRFVLAAAVIAAIAIPKIPEQYIGRFESIFTGEEAEGRSSEARLQILSDSIEIFAENPLGVGVAAFPAARFEKFGKRPDTHNLYMEVATNLGIQGLIAFGLLLMKISILFYRQIRSLSSQLSAMSAALARDRKDAPPEFEKHYADLEFMKAICMATSGYLLVRLVLGLFGHDLYEIYWWVIIGLLYALHRANVVSQVKTNELVSNLKTKAEATSS